jgi:hypothetical protein
MTSYDIATGRATVYRSDLEQRTGVRALAGTNQGTSPPPELFARYHEPTGTWLVNYPDGDSIGYPTLLDALNGMQRHDGHDDA